MKKILMTLLTLSLCTSLFASVVTITGKGGNKEKALDMALQKAVESFVITKVTKPTADASYAKLQPAIYASYKDFISKYEVVTENEAGGLFTVEIRADIDDAKINGQLLALGIQPGIGGKPKVAVFASEQNVDGSWVHSYYGSYFMPAGNAAMGEASFNICEGSVMNAVMNGGFPVVDTNLDPTEAKKAYQYKPVFERYDENMFNIPNDNAAKLARVVDNDVGIVITCSALAKNQGQKSAYMNSISANVSCKAVNVKNNTRVANAIATAAVPHIDPITGGNKALEKACGEVATKLVTALSDKY